jgi:hypothetical protein
MADKGCRRLWVGLCGAAAPDRRRQETPGHTTPCDFLSDTALSWRAMGPIPGHALAPPHVRTPRPKVFHKC